MLHLIQRSAITVAAAALTLFLTVGDIGSPSVAADTATAPSGSATTTACPGPSSATRPTFTPSAHAMGTIAAINGTSSFTVTEKNNTTSTVTVDATTHYGKTVTASLSTIAVGDLIMAKGTTPSTGTFAATAITDNGKPMPRTGAASGTTPRTTRPAGTRPALPAGCTPPKRPTGGTTGTHKNQGTFAVGIVQQINGTSVTIGFPKGGKTTTVTTTGNTTVTAHQQGSFADLHVGDQVVASAARKSGTAGSATAFTAAFVSDQTAH